MDSLSDINMDGSSKPIKKLHNSRSYNNEPYVFLNTVFNNVAKINASLINKIRQLCVLFFV